MIVLTEVYVREMELKSLEFVEKNLTFYVNPAHVVMMVERDLSMKLSTGGIYYFRNHTSWEYIRNIVYNYGS